MDMIVFNKVTPAVDQIETHPFHQQIETQKFLQDNRVQRITQNFEVFDFELSDTDMAQIKTLDEKQSAFFDHRDPAIVKWLGGRK